MDEIDEMGEIGLHFALLARATSLPAWSPGVSKTVIITLHTDLSHTAPVK